MRAGGQRGGVRPRGGWAFNRGVGGAIQPSGYTLPQKRGSIDGPQNPTQTDPRAPEETGAQNWQKMKMESARRGGSEKSSCAMYLVETKRPFSMLKTIFGAFGARIHSD